MAFNGRLLNTRWQQTYQVSFHCLRSSECAHINKNNGFTWLVCCHLLMVQQHIQGKVNFFFFLIKKLFAKLQRITRYIFTHLLTIIKDVFEQCTAQFKSMLFEQNKQVYFKGILRKFTGCFPVAVKCQSFLCCQFVFDNLIKSVLDCQSEGLL